MADGGRLRRLAPKPTRTQARSTAVFVGTPDGRLVLKMPLSRRPATGANAAAPVQSLIAASGGCVRRARVKPASKPAKPRPILPCTSVDDPLLAPAPIDIAWDREPSLQSNHSGTVQPGASWLHAPPTCDRDGYASSSDTLRSATSGQYCSQLPTTFAPMLDVVGRSGALLPSGAQCGDSAQKLYKCSFCGRSFKRRFTYNVHVRTHTGARPYQCMLCGHAFKQNVNVKRHIKTHMVFPCMVFEKDLAKVMRRSISENGLVEVRLQCPYCALPFGSKPHLGKHLGRMHAEEKRYACALAACAQLSGGLADALRHAVWHAGRGDKLFSCGRQACNATFSSLQEASDHQLTHADAATVVQPSTDHAAADAHRKCIFVRCFDCNKRFKSLKRLKRHRETALHENKCTECSRSFTLLPQLRRHLATVHSKPRHRCLTCGKMFSYGPDLQKHAKQHRVHGFGCGVCGRRLSRRDTLRRHLLTVHAFRKQYRCQVPGCKSSYRRRDHLVRHIGTHRRASASRPESPDTDRAPEEPTPVRSVSCTKCGRQFTWRSDFRRHRCAKR